MAVAWAWEISAVDPFMCGSNFVCWFAPCFTVAILSAIIDRCAWVSAGTGSRSIL